MLSFRVYAVWLENKFVLMVLLFLIFVSRRPLTLANSLTQ